MDKSCLNCLFSQCLGISTIDGKKLYQCGRDKPQSIKKQACEFWKKKDNVIRLRPFTDEEKTL